MKSKLVIFHLFTKKFIPKKQPSNTGVVHLIHRNQFHIKDESCTSQNYQLCLLKSKNWHFISYKGKIASCA